MLVENNGLFGVVPKEKRVYVQFNKEECHVQKSNSPNFYRFRAVSG